LVEQVPIWNEQNSAPLSLPLVIHCMRCTKGFEKLQSINLNSAETSSNGWIDEVLATVWLDLHKS
jgi:hypothetical protein